jgi:CHAT domain-containing protein
MLFAGIAKELRGSWRGKRLVIVAAGALDYLPFAALPLPQASDGPTVGRPTATPLIAEHEVVEVPSASVLATLRREAAERRPARRAVAVVADPVFDRGDPRVARLSPRPPGQLPPSRPAASASSISGGSYLTSRAMNLLGERRGSALSRLPFTRDEARAITALAGPDTSLSAMDFRATRAAVLGNALEDYRIVHFATHGLIDTERPELSGLILSLVNDRGTPEDGFLRLHDIFNMRLNADLVVLSACQTALGQEVKGEGLVGLTRGFMYAGTPRVVASLWEVSDSATAELMKKFYTGMLRRRLTPAAALRSAQREMSADARWASPYFWAGFVLQGDWK